MAQQLATLAYSSSSMGYVSRDTLLVRYQCRRCIEQQPRGGAIFEDTHVATAHIWAAHHAEANALNQAGKSPQFSNAHFLDSFTSTNGHSSAPVFFCLTPGCEDVVPLSKSVFMKHRRLHDSMCWTCRCWEHLRRNRGWEVWTSFVAKQPRAHMLGHLGEQIGLEEDVAETQH